VNNDHSTKIVSMTPAVFHLSEAVNNVSRHYGEQPIVPRGPRLRPLLDGVRHGIRDALGADGYHAVMMTGSGSTAMAAVIGSCLKREERLLVIRNGAYGDRIKVFAERVGQTVIDLPAKYGVRPDLTRVKELCESDAVDAIAVVYGCTTSCSLNPVDEIAQIAQALNKKLFIDGVSALFVEELDFASAKPAAVMGSCNKGLHSHPNLTFALVSDGLMAEMESIPPRAPSLELFQTWQRQEAGAHPYTIDPMSLCQVQAALDHLATQGGISGRHRIYAERCRVLRAGYERLGLELATWEGMPLSSIGTALMIPDGHTYESIADALANQPYDGHTFEIYAAQGPLSDKIFRVFHMGEYPLETYEIFLASFARVLG
jgi:2-aminoethylphosphonate-pyruvate transaminase